MNPHNDCRPQGMRRSQRGQALWLVAAGLTGILVMLAFTIEIGNLYYTYKELQSITSAAALAGGAQIPVGAATTTAKAYSGGSTATYNIPRNLDITNVSVALTCVNPTSYPNMGLPTCVSYGWSEDNGNPINAIQVTEQATVYTFFAKIFGLSSFNLTAKASASAKGGSAPPYHVMMVLDTTASMGSGTDSNCSAGGNTGNVKNPTPEQCAQEGMQELMLELDPCSTSLTSCSGSYTPVDQVGLMVFPGLCSQALTGSGRSQTCPTDSGTATYTSGPQTSDDYSCTTSNPVTTPYNNNPAYLVVPLSSNYRTSDTITSLNISSDDVLSVAAGLKSGTSTCDGVQTPGGEGTFYAGVLSEANAYLNANSVANTQNVIILLSDGDATSSANMTGSVKTPYNSNSNTLTFPSTTLCEQAVDEANFIKSETNEDSNVSGFPTLIYSVSYGSESTGCDTDGGDAYKTPCLTMENIASTPTSQYFFSVPQSGSGNNTVCTGARDITALSQVFQAIAGDLTTSRLIPNSVY